MDALAFENLIQRILSRSTSDLHSILASKYNRVLELRKTNSEDYRNEVQELLHFVKACLVVLQFTNSADEKLLNEIGECFPLLEERDNLECLDFVQGRLNNVL